MNFQNMNLRSKVFLGGGIPLALLAIIGIITLMNLNKMIQTGQWVEHTHKVLEKATNIVGSAVDMETGMRGYLLAGKDGFLNPYKDGQQSTYTQIESLKKTVSDNPGQVKRLDEMEKTLKEWQTAVTEPMIALRRKIGDSHTMNDMAKLVGKAKGKKYFDKFREQIAIFIQRESTLMEKRNKNFDTAQVEISEGLKALSETIDWVDHTYKVLDSADFLMRCALDMETGFRGFLLAGQEEFLEPYLDAKRKFFKEVKSLQKTVSDNPPQVARLKKIDNLIQTWLDRVTKHAIALRKSVNSGFKTMNDVASYVAQKKGKQYFDTFRENIAAFSKIEAELLIKRKKASETANQQAQSNLKTIDKSKDWVVHTYKVIMDANAILATAVDMETGMRGYLLAGKEEFLSPYKNGQERFKESLQKLKETVSDNPSQVQLHNGVATLASSSTELSSASQSMKIGAENTSGKSDSVAKSADELSANMSSIAAAIEETSTNVNVVASGAEEMSSTINEISGNTREARTITEKAVAQAHSASSRVDKLGKSANEIGYVTESITEISEQTNLLALNATIEAARAGDAGKGFAVVANEIKELAKQTGSSTEDIKTKIGDIQGLIGTTVTEIEEITNVIKNVNDIVTTISIAIEEQSSATNEIASNISQASQGIREVNENVNRSSVVSDEIAKDIRDVNVDAKDISANSSQVNMSASELSKLSEQLREMVNKFKT
ncbi:MAG: chemotaxis transducer [Candidatus Magnetoglobus multicellularis str. Araruama]|uniref:Chemotaxis transducer n=1 Tax=Candidatus Magnetoglobus multicellularis str. Araruama TaxID=890399 RepID=A0A1V1PA89_9BACT|nr:MAG: chemotaxis transducer [Candidatus Magnetoglobus multicellularis str. Araruama]